MVESQKTQYGWWKRARGLIATGVRVLVAAACIASLLLSVGAIVLRSRSFSNADEVIWRRQIGDAWIAEASRGQFLIGHSLYPKIDRRPVTHAGLSYYTAPATFVFDA